ncbi:MAG: hypothetical protein KKC75_01710 [Nanoarchaeota archaeon]|nr:hypothetical protein [Nanoarchaeota archaeon]MBU1005341.1 hypothetical protein [Nanoarchaeota archaeon]MBU1946233.1 hypothetical protein [Nanoarchaeota archaeon]
MMEMKDWVSGMVGFLVLCIGLLPMLNKMGIGPSWFNFSLPIVLLSWIIVAAGFYLIINSFIEITNSNIVGWASFAVAAVITTIGLLQALGRISWISGNVFNALFIVVGLFLMLATFAMEM